MKPDNIVCCALRVNRELFRKFRHVAGFEGRGINREITRLMKRRVRDFGALRGPAPWPARRRR